MKDVVEGLQRRLADTLPGEEPEGLKARVAYRYTKGMIDKLGQILATHDPEDAKAFYQSLVAFLGENWGLIKGTALSYTASQDLDATKVCCELAQHLSANEEVRTTLGLDPAKSALELLIPGISVESINDKIFPPLYRQGGRDINLSDFLKKHIIVLDRGECYPLPVSLLPMEAERNNRLSARAMNPYQPVDDDLIAKEGFQFVQPADLQRLQAHSSTTEVFEEARANYEALTTSSDSLNLLSMLNRLVWHLNHNSVNDKGTEDVAGKDADSAIEDFYSKYRAFAGLKDSEDISSYRFPDIPQLPQDIGDPRQKAQLERLVQELKTLHDYFYQLREPDYGRCLATRRDELMKEMRGLEPILEGVALDSATQKGLIEQADIRFQESDAALRRGLREGDYAGAEECPITLDLLERLDIPLLFTDLDSSVQILSSMRAELIREVFSDVALQNSLAAQINGVDDFAVLMNALHVESLSSLFDSFGKEKIMQLMMHRGEDDIDEALALEEGTQILPDVLLQFLPINKRDLLIQHIDVNAVGQTANYKEMTMLHQYASDGNIEMMTYLLENGADIEKREAEEDGRTPLYEATQEGRIEAVKVLHGRGANLEAPGGVFKRSPIHVAASSGDNEMFRTLVELGANVRSKDANGFSLLVAAIAGGNERIIQWVVQEHPELIHIKARNDATALMSAASAEDGLSAIKILIENGAKIDETDEDDNSTALMYAAYYNRGSVIPYLLECGSQIDAVDKTGNTALMIAIKRMGIGAAISLIMHGASLKRINHEAECPLEIAIRQFPIDEGVEEDKRLLDLVGLIVLRSSPLDAPLQEKLSSQLLAHPDSLLEAMNIMSPDARRVLCANIDFPSNILHEVSQVDELDESFIGDILARCSDINCIDTDGNTPLMLAAQNGDLNFVQLLLQRGADFTVTNQLGQNAFDLSEESAITELLEARQAEISLGGKAEACSTAAMLGEMDLKGSKTASKERFDRRYEEELELSGSAEASGGMPDDVEPGTSATSKGSEPSGDGSHPEGDEPEQARP